jgi:ribonuclease HII
VTRDRLMMAYAQRYPSYGFERHKGYPTREHYARIRTDGPCAIHRRSFRGVLNATVRS